MAKANTFVEKDSTRYLLTWNSFGNKFRQLHAYLDKTTGIESKITMVCCQEFGSPAELNNPDKVKADHSYKFVPFSNRAGGMHVFWHSWSKTHNASNVSDNLRCTVAAIRCGPAGDIPACEVLLEQSQRPVIGLDYGETYIYSFHNDAHGGAAAPARAMIAWVAQNNKGRHWMIGGDFNCTPNQLAGDFVVRWDTTRTTTRRNSQTGAEIPGDLFDYVVQSTRANGGEGRRLSQHIGQRQPPVPLSSDHFPVLFQMFSTKGRM